MSDDSNLVMFPGVRPERLAEDAAQAAARVDAQDADDLSNVLQSLQELVLFAQEGDGHGSRLRGVAVVGICQDDTLVRVMAGNVFRHPFVVVGALETMKAGFMARYIDGTMQPDSVDPADL